MNYTHQPVVRTILADLLTPVALYDRLAGAPYTYLLESVEGGERWARYSMIGLPAREVATIRDHHLTIRRDGAVIEERELADPLAWLADYHATIRPAPLPVDLPFSGGLVGYLAYDSIGYIEKRLAKRPQNDPLGVPDNLRGEVHLISHADLADPDGLAAAEARLDAMVAAINRPGTAQVRALNRHARPPAIQHHYPEARFKADVAKIREYIKAGDCMQVVPSQRMSCAYTHAPLDYYRALRHTNPSPYMYLLASRATPSPCARSPAHANAAKPRKKTKHSNKNCWQMPKKSPNTSCSSILAATTLAASAKPAASKSAKKW